MLIDKTLEIFISENEKTKISKSKNEVSMLIQMVKSKLYDNENFILEIEDLIYELNNERFSIEDLKDFLENNNPSLNQSVLSNSIQEQSIDSIEEHDPEGIKINISKLLTKDYNNQISSIHQQKKFILQNTSSMLTSKKTESTPKNELISA